MRRNHTAPPLNITEKAITRQVRSIRRRPSNIRSGPTSLLNLHTGNRKNKSEISRSVTPCGLFFVTWIYRIPRTLQVVWGRMVTPICAHAEWVASWAQLPTWKPPNHRVLFMNAHALESLLSDKFKLGANVSVAAGPVGRNASAGTDLKLNAESLSYSRAKGVFAGVSLDGAVVQADKSGDKAMYGRDIDRHQIPSPRRRETCCARFTNMLGSGSIARPTG